MLPQSFVFRKCNGTYHADTGETVNCVLEHWLNLNSTFATTYGHESDVYLIFTSCVFVLPQSFLLLFLPGPMPSNLTFPLLQLLSMNYFIYLSILYEYWKMNVCHRTSCTQLTAFLSISGSFYSQLVAFLIAQHFLLKLNIAVECLFNFMRFQNVQNLIWSSASRSPYK